MRIGDKFKELEKKKERALIGYVMAGDPSPEDTVTIAAALLSGGVDIIELGLPFSDPIADGVAIQKAGERALSAGMNTDIFFATAKKITGAPKVCMTYYNLVLQRGLERFAKDCVDSGVTGLIIPDLPVEEADGLLSACRKYGVDLIFLVAPTTTEKRLGGILEASKGFIYVVSLLGVTGVRDKLSGSVGPLLKRIRAKTDLPLAVGFGISKPEHVKEIIGSGADGVIVGSAFIRIIEENLSDRRKMLADLTDFARRMKAGTKNVH
jgi:tryptophan synthase alpha chain